MRACGRGLFCIACLRHGRAQVLWFILSAGVKLREKRVVIAVVVIILLHKYFITQSLQTMKDASVGPERHEPTVEVSLAFCDDEPNRDRR